MSTIESFNDMMTNFLNELCETFPEDEKLYEAKMGFAVCRTTHPRWTLDQFMDSVKPYAEKLMAKDESFILQDTEKIEALKDLHIKDLWNAEGVSDTTRGAVWQYMQSLYILGTTITMFPPETLSMIESVAEQCASNMQQTGSFDMSALNGLFSSLMGSSSPLPIRPPAPKAPGAPKKTTRKPGTRKK
jgi:hypothetical protein